jgi:glutathione S-transferase
MMIDLYVYKPHWGLLNASPFCMKLEVYLKLAHIPYKIHYTHNPRISPTQKLPFIKDGTKSITDSSVIMEYLKTTSGVSLDQHLKPLQLAESLAVQRLVEEHLYFALVYSRWVDDAAWATTKTEFFQDLPKILQAIVPGIVRKQVKKQLWAQGIGRQSAAHIYAAGRNDLAAVAELLGGNKYFFGDTVSSIDAVIYAFLAGILQPPIASPLQTFIKENAALVNYHERIQQLLL